MNEENDLQELKGRELRHLMEWEDHKAYIRLVKKYGVPKTEQEREDLWNRAEKNVSKRKDINKLMNEFIGIENE